MNPNSVSVIIPCYNAAQYIRRTLDSILSQEYQNLEIIAIDDGSKDNTKAILDSYVPRIKILFHQNHANLGQAASLNLGISKTTSEFIAFMDSDDLWFPGNLEKQVKIFHEKPDIGLVYTNGYVIDENDKIMYELFPDDFVESYIIGEILLKCYIRTPSSVMVRRKIFEDTKLFKTHIFSTDHDMWVRMAEVTKFYYLANHLAGYRKRKGSISTTRRLWEDGFIILKDACERYPYGLNIRRKRLAILYYRLGEYDWGHGNYFHSLLNLFLSGILDPFRALGIIYTKIINYSI